MTIAGSFSAVMPPTCIFATSIWFNPPNKLNPPPPFLMIPASLARRLFNRLIGAPVSKINLYGPLSLIITSNNMCRDGNNLNGIVTALSLGGAWHCPSCAQNVI